MIKNLTIKQLGEQGELLNQLTIPLNPHEVQVVKEFISEILVDKGVIETYNEEEYIKLTADISHALMTIQNIFNSENKLSISLEN